ncbi:hypothetical protein [Pontibacillus litoralis]|uniref:Uncharacterized protein n=1 Tax=Pontibacillus litoralis JSM 072002 TaxID=1385512 RepID=A0A0A5G6C7_9BACI|nr:hypothetical protein [Pontibacillus litoralis]KGX86645.1 hypothetical protein N784_04360 [Pontibacillus litoralis JSM 072002]
MIIVKEELLKSEEACTYSFSLEEAGYYSINAQVTSDTDWAIKGNESCLVEVMLDLENGDVMRFHFVTYMGKVSHNYKVNFGYLQQGSYSVTIRNVNNAVCNEADMYLHQLELARIPLDKELTLVYKHAPVLYGRNHFTTYDGCYTDTPLALMYSYYLNEAGQLQIDYEFVFSHEDEGTPGKLLMSKWGRNTDIEWCYTVKLDADHFGVIERSYQGPEHEYRLFTGDFLLHTQRPILQVRTTNGNFDHKLDSNYCFALHPDIKWDKKLEPREKFMKQYNYINTIMIKEAERQLINHEEDKHRIAHPTKYVYAFFYVNEEHRNAVIDLVYKTETDRYISSAHDFYQPPFGYGSYTGGFAKFLIAMEMDLDWSVQDLHVRLLDGERMEIQKMEFYALRANGALEELYRVEESITLTQVGDCKRVKEGV